MTSLAVESWPATIGEMVVLHQRELQLQGAEDELTLPAVAATEQRLVETEAALDHPLDPSWRMFLRHADGWPRFQLDYTLFGTAALLTDPPRLTGELGLSFLETAEYRDLFGADQGDVMVIGGSEENDDVFVMTGPHAERPGEVTWFYSHGVVGRHPSFDDFFLGQLQLVRHTVAALERGQEAQSSRIVVRGGQYVVLPGTAGDPVGAAPLPVTGIDPNQLGTAARQALAAPAQQSPVAQEIGVTLAVFRAHPIYGDHVRLMRTNQRGGVDRLELLLGLDALNDPGLLGRTILEQIGPAAA